MGIRFDVDVRYDVLDVVGQGAYGVVCAAHDSIAGEAVAIKKIANAFEHATYTKRTLREIRLLRLLRHDNIVRLKTLLPPVKSDGFRDLYIISDLLETDLSSVIKSPQPLSDEHVQFFIYQVLRGVKFLHTCSPPVTHRDLKPRNLLVNSNCDLKICDFGLARTNTEKEFMTEYVVTRWYRAPELLLSCSEYTAAIDIWSVGCIFAELLGRKPIFPGKDYVHQLNLITKVLGSPSEEDLAFVESEKAKRYMRSLPKSPKTPLHRFYPHTSAQALDLIDKMLVFDPTKRITVEEALAHPYLASLHDKDDEPCCLDTFADPFANESLDVVSAEEAQRARVRELVYQESLQFRPERV